MTKIIMFKKNKMYFCIRNNETTLEEVFYHITFLYAISAIIWQFLCLYFIQNKSG